MRLSKADLAPRHCHFTTFLFAPPPLPPKLSGFEYSDSAGRKVVVLHIRNDRNESGGKARVESGRPQG